MPRPHHHGPRSTRTLPVIAATAGLALVGIAVGTGAAPAAASSRPVVVGPTDSIQAAIDAAGPGTTIVVRGGVHAEQLTISTDRITLVGDHTRIVPPAAATTNTCTGLGGPIDAVGTPSQAGICVSGTDVVLAEFEREHRELVSVGRRVRGVTITGLQIEGFSGPNVAFVGAANARLDDNQLIDGAQYGAVTVGSTSTRFTGNVVSTTDLRNIGLCADDVTPATVDHNDVSGYVVGLCVQTDGADFRHNTAHDNCIGVFVDPGIGATVRNNRVVANNAPCAELFSFIDGIGVFLSGADGTRVTGNRISGHTPDGYGAGVVVTDDEVTGLPSTDNVVRNNRFEGNTLDLLVDTAGSGNVVVHNRCATSLPAGLCS